MLEQLISYAFPMLELACGIAIVIRFRGLPRIFGGIAFGVWLATGLARRLLSAFDVEWYDYNLAFTLLGLAGYGFLLAAFLTGRVVTEADRINERTDSPVLPVDPQLAGIGGWLILPAIGLVLGPLVAVVSLIALFVLFPEVGTASHGGIFALEIIVALGLTCFLIYAAILFFRKRGNAPSTIIVLLITAVVTQFMLLVIELGAGAEDFAVASGKALLQSIVSAAIWIPYFRKSKRVKATFVQ